MTRDLFVALREPGELCEILRDDLADARRDARMWRLMFRAAMDQLALVATAPERYEQIQRDLRKDREKYMARAFRGAHTPKEPQE